MARPAAPSPTGSPPTRHHVRAGPRGRPLRLADRPVHPHAGRAAVPDRQPVLRLEVRDRPRAGAGRPQGLPRPRQGARRVEQHQRDDLPARQPDGLRALGRRARHEGVGLPPLPALLQADGELPGRRRRLARRRRPAQARARAGDQPAVRRVLRGRSRRPATRSPTTSTATGRRASRRFDRNVYRGRRLSAARAYLHPVRDRKNLTDRDLRDGHRRPVRGQARGRRRLRAGRARASTRRGRRGDPLRRRDQHPAAAPALRRRRPGAARSSTASRSSTTCPGWGRTCRTTSRSTSSTPPSCRCRSRPASSGTGGPASPTSGSSTAAGSAPPTTSRAAASRAATTTSTTRT